MNRLNIELFEVDDLKMEIIDNEVGITLRLIGRISVDEVARMCGQYINNLHRKIIQNEIKNVIIDFTQLIYANSSSLNVFIKWMSLVDAMEQDENNYKIVIIYKKEVPWHVKHLSTLEDIVPDLITTKGI